MKKIFLLAFIAIAFGADADTWHVGPSQTYTMPSQVSTLVQDGDTVLIDSGMYASDVARWQANDLVIKGVNGRARLFSNGMVYGGKGIWVIQGDNTIVENIEFAEAACPDLNGAGIRQEGTNLTVRHCYFHDNENGILSGADVNSDILIEYTEFYNNGYGDGFSHNLYIGHINKLTFQYNYSHHADVGHELKSRAEENYILHNRFDEGATGTASRSIDLPNGGRAVIVGNVIEKGPNSQNSNLIGYGQEGITNSDASVYLVNNTIVNNRPTGSFLALGAGTLYGKVMNNIFAGTGTLITGMAAQLDSGGNIVSTIGAAGFVNATAYDFHLVASSPAVNHCNPPGYVGAFNLLPTHEYVDTAAMVTRNVNGQLDAGAFEYGVAASVAGVSIIATFRAYPNPAHEVVQVQVSGDIKQLHLYDNTGRLLQSRDVRDGKISFTTQGYAAGLYFLKADNGAGEVLVIK